MVWFRVVRKRGTHSDGRLTAMRVLFTSVPQVGHLFPMVPLAWAMRCAGDEVLVTTPAPGFTDRVSRTGLPVAVIGDATLRDYARVSVVDDAAAPLESGFALSGRGWADLALRSLPALRALVSQYTPDLIVSEPAETAGRIVAAERGLPWLEHSWGLPAPPQFTAAADALVRERTGTPLAPPIARLHPSPPALWPDATPPRGMAMRYVPYNGDSVRTALPPRAPGRRRALVTFGSLLVRHGSTTTAEFFRKLLDELAGLGVELVVGLDAELVREFAPLPPEVVHTGWAPLNLTLPECDLVVHHGGSGTSMTAAVSGVPQLIVPQSTDQFTTAECLDRHGCAVTFTGPAATAATIGEAAARMLADPRSARRAADLAARVRALPGPAAVSRQIRGMCTAPKEGTQPNV
ncbi:DUF1205 domain-containing protein [Dactylosporangium vinaceum]